MVVRQAGAQVTGDVVEQSRTSHAHGDSACRLKDTGRLGPQDLPMAVDQFVGIGMPAEKRRGCPPDGHLRP